MVLPPELSKKYHPKANHYNQTASKAEQIALCQFIRDGHLAAQSRKLKRLYAAKLKDLLCAVRHAFGQDEMCIRDSSRRMEDFHSMGCKICDHGMDYVMYYPASEEEVECIFSRRLSGEHLTNADILKFKTAFMIFSAQEYKKYNWVMQLHFGCRRNNNNTMFQKLGPDTGFDCISDFTPISQLANFLDALSMKKTLPKTILYSLNPSDDEQIAALALSLIHISGTVMVYGGFSIVRLTMTQSTASLGIPMGMVYTILPISGILIVLYSVLNIIDLIRGAANVTPNRKTEKYRKGV